MRIVEEPAPKSAEIDVRKLLVDALQADLQGPADLSAECELSDPPTRHYLCGVLFPKGAMAEAEEDDEADSAIAEDETGSDAKLPYSEDPFLPSSIGITCALDNSAVTVKVDGWFATYERKEHDNKRTYRRKIHHYSIDLPLETPFGRELVSAGVFIRWISRKNTNQWVISVFLSNEQTCQEIGNQDEFCVFQPKLRVTTQGKAIVARDSEFSYPPSDPDIQSYRLLYDDQKVFATGHGCAAEWMPTSENCTNEVSTSTIPYFVVPAVAARDISETEVPGLSMSSLYEATDASAIKTMLQPLINSYREWIAQLKHRALQRLSSELIKIAERHLNQCEETADRLAAGLKCLETDPKAFESFKFANRAMFEQRMHSLWAKERRAGTSMPYEQFLARTSKPKWRPFQIAFFLMSLADIANPNSATRETVDLLWFPTGGGKTEAYLGLAAFVMAYRRYRGPVNGLSGDGGVTVLMRYTLRLLTIQQFQRAATLICACEQIRRTNPDRWGHNPFGIGLWVGQAATPNFVCEAEEALAELRVKGDDFNGSNPVQVLHCPWCGEELSWKNYSADLEQRRLLITCGRKACEFSQSSNPIPIAVVDEEIYLRCPDLLIGTADKIAALPRNPRTKALFGLVDRFCPRHGYGGDGCNKTHNQTEKLPKATVQSFAGFVPPELIIQDELHLISGPLGTLAGIYEIAVDRLMQREGIARPKIIASTATIRRAQDQVANLYGRPVRQFPPPGISARDSFFAYESSESPGRMYLGIYAPGKSGKTSSTRITGCLLDSIDALRENTPDSNYDPYGTIVAYFNSLRELGGSLRLAEDDIPDRVKLLRRRRGATLGGERPEYAELTSRLKSHEVPHRLSRLEASAFSPDGLRLLYCTNMISVGVDVDRLGLMLVHGQPKSTSEYIQCTSRVGRNDKAPGLVITLYSWNRPRDTDHFERFQSYHAMLYRYVEATSVTPMAPRARDRAMHAVLIALTRLLDAALEPNSAASNFRINAHAREIADWMFERISAIGALNNTELAEVRKEIDALAAWWENRAVGTSGNLRYAAYPMDKISDPAKREVLMTQPGQDFKDAKLTPSSLRDVEANCTLYYINRD